MDARFTPVILVILSFAAGQQRGKMGMMMNNELEAGKNGLGLGIARDESKSFRCVFSRPS